MTKGYGGLQPCACFRLFGRKKNRRAFNDVDQLEQGIKFNFLSVFVFVCVCVYVEDNSMNLIDFVDWLSIKEGEGFFSSSCLF